MDYGFKLGYILMMHSLYNLILDDIHEYPYKYVGSKPKYNNNLLWILGV